MLLSIAVVTTEASARYGKQLLSHLGHKVTVEPLPDQPAPAGRLVFAYGVGTVLPMPGRAGAAGDCGRPGIVGACAGRAAASSGEVRRPPGTRGDVGAC